MRDAPDTARDGQKQGMRMARLGIFSVLMVLTACALFVVSATPLFRFSPFESDVVNHVLNYQLSALPVAGFALVLTFAFAGRVRLGYLNLNRRGEMRTFTGRSGGGRWESDGWVIGLIMTAIVGVVTFFQFLPGGFAFHWLHLALIVPFAAMNAFTEEAVFRLPYVTMGDNDTNSRVYGLVMGSAVFGVLHFWGVAPNGFLGAIMAAYVGYFLARSIQETRGFYWAFMIHFMLNLATMLFVLNQAP